MTLGTWDGSSPIRAWQSEIRAIALAFNDILIDTKHDRHAVAYSLDYSNFSPIVWPDRTDPVLKSDTSVSRQTDYLAQSIMTNLPVINNLLPIKAIMPPTSFLELERSISDSVKWQTEVSSSYKIADVYIDKIDQVLSAADDSDQMALDLSRLAARLPGSETTDGVDYIVSMLKRDVIKSLSEIVDFSRLNEYREAFQRSSDIVLAYLNKIRADQSSSIDSLSFKNRMDAFALAIPDVISHSGQDVSVKFCGSAPKGINGVAGISHKDIRHPLSLHSTLKSLIKWSGDPAAWNSARGEIELLRDRALQFTKYMDVESIGALGLAKTEALKMFYKAELGGVLDTDDNKRPNADHKKQRLMLAVDGGREAFMSRFAKNAEEMKARADLLKEEIPRLLPDEVVEFYNVRSLVDGLTL